MTYPKILMRHGHLRHLLANYVGFLYSDVSKNDE